MRAALKSVNVDHTQSARLPARSIANAPFLRIKKLRFSIHCVKYLLVSLNSGSLGKNLRLVPIKLRRKRNFMKKTKIKKKFSPDLYCTSTFSGLRQRERSHSVKVSFLTPPRA